MTPTGFFLAGTELRSRPGSEVTVPLKFSFDPCAVYEDLPASELILPESIDPS